MNRRMFLSGLGLTTASAAVAGSRGLAWTSLGPKADQLYKVGYAAITWGGNDRQAIADISELGFRGIQLRGNTFKDFGSKVAELKSLLKDADLEMGVFSSGNLDITKTYEEQADQHKKHADFARNLGCTRVQITNNARPKTGSPTGDDLKKYGEYLTRLGNEFAKQDVQLVYHNHMHQLGETPEEVDAILNNSDAKVVKLLLDIAHYKQGGGDPAKCIKRYKDRLQAVHLKDVAQGKELKGGYKFVELGQGVLDLPSVINALEEVKFAGWAMVELDSVPEQGRTPKECAATSKNYLVKTLSVEL